MVNIDPETLLEWLQTGHEDVRDMQLIALEQLCKFLYYRIILIDV